MGWVPLPSSAHACCLPDLRSSVVVQHSMSSPAYVPRMGLAVMWTHRLVLHAGRCSMLAGISAMWSCGHVCGSSPIMRQGYAERSCRQMACSWYDACVATTILMASMLIVSLSATGQR